jgi:hypothetical protein
VDLLVLRVLRVYLFFDTDLFTLNFVEHTSSQFHQHFMNNFCANILAPKNYKAKFDEIDTSSQFHQQ